MDYKDLGKRIRQLRLSQHKTQEMLAEEVDLSPSYLGHIERGTRTASLETLIHLCRALDTDPNHLLAASIPPKDSSLSETTRKQLAELLHHAYRLVKPDT